MNTWNSFVSKNEADALKDMIFKRVRERAQSMTEDVQDDVMDMARESFVSKDNPFSMIIEKAEKQNPTEKIEPVSAKEEIGFPQRELSPHAKEQGKIVSEKLTAYAIQNNMDEARAGLSNKKSFMGALDFLNAQAAVSLMRTKTESFEVVA